MGKKEVAMELKDFLVLAAKKFMIFHPTICGWSYFEYERFAKLTEHIDYHCDFKKDGTCKRYKKPSRDNACCCDGCFSLIGYHRELPNDYNRLRLYADLFKPKEYDENNNLLASGFWKRGKGCVLPREMRSSTCLTYSCRGETKRTPWDTKLMSILITKEGNMTVYGKRCTYEWQAYEQMVKWLEDGPEKPEKGKRKRKK
jgi:hypothetical protein